MNHEDTRAAAAAAPTNAKNPWKPLVTAFQQSRPGVASWQLVNSVGSYLGVWVAIVFLAPISWWLALPLCLLNGAILVRVFIILHDCGHGSFFGSRRANHFWGFFTGVLTFTPYHHWSGLHAIHHGTAGNLDRRGVGDFWTLTVREYMQSPWWRRLAYRVARNPAVLLLVAPLIVFVVDHRRPRARCNAVEKRSVWMTNIALGGMITGMGFAMGFLPFIVMQLVVLAVAGGIGVWLFYLQHQFEDAYWERGDEWDYAAAALQGSAFLRLPRVLQWFTGNIGFHHIHHLSSRVPNYNLQACHESHPMFQEVHVMTFWGAVKSLGLKLWDEAEQRLVCFREAKRLGQAPA